MIELVFASALQVGSHLRDLNKNDDQRMNKINYNKINKNQLTRMEKKNKEKKFFFF